MDKTSRKTDKERKLSSSHTLNNSRLTKSDDPQQNCISVVQTISQMDAAAFFRFGLHQAGHSYKKASLDQATKLDFHRFRSYYGIGPTAGWRVFKEIEDKKLVENPKINHFLVALSWMKQYPTESNHAGHWNLTENTTRKICWKYAEAFQELKEQKIKWTCHDPENLPDEVFIASVDGVHCMISEIRSNPDKKWFSHKHKTAGVVYELAIAVFDGSLIWINGPFPAGQSDLAVFRKPGGLKSKIPDGKRVIADQGYKAENMLSTRNPMDTPQVKELKRRAKARHEVFNGLLKNFQILSTRFRTTHGGEQERLDRHKRVFEGCCVLVMYEIEDDHPLFTV